MLGFFVISQGDRSGSASNGNALNRTRAFPCKTTGKNHLLYVGMYCNPACYGRQQSVRFGFRLTKHGGRIAPPVGCKPISLASVTRLLHPLLAVCPSLLCELGQVVQPVCLRNAGGINHVTEVVSRIS
jgi:hypothetical protein